LLGATSIPSEEATMPGLPAPRTPFAELDELRSRLERAYDQWFDGHDRTWMPALDVERDEKHLTVRADIPGFKAEDVKIEVKDGILTISGEQDQQTEQQDKDYLRSLPRSRPGTT
jgi:HSP20 family molecular chaperone IbpA